MIDGIINIYKEKGYTSHDVVAKMRGILKQKKIGHTGTLDPDATGVLPVCLGQATKLCDMLTDRSKVYEAVMLLGKATDTQDISGKVLKEAEPETDEEKIRSAVLSFAGEYKQIPPMYSAIKIDGRKLVDLARQGIEVEREARTVNIFEIEIIKTELPRVYMRVHCSKGTYIRTLCNDIGERLGCFACMEDLVRSRVDRFELSDAIKLSQLAGLAASGDIEKYIIKPEEYFENVRAAHTRARYDRYLRNGNKLEYGYLQEDCASETELRLYTSSGEFVGIYQKNSGGLKPKKLFIGGGS